MNEKNSSADNLIDLPVDATQANETKGGDGHQGQIHIESFSWGSTNPSASSLPSTPSYSIVIDPRNS